uniref:Tc1-like transposase DDE domain-containing protein n=1 Tax=Oncorhynchus tshawytscha TaxID=74940 RepID=A0AAZ3NY81_ONCTS
MELSTGKILQEYFPFQQDNNLKHKAKSTLEFLTKKSVNVPMWPSYSFDLNLLENLWQDLKTVAGQ